MGVRSWQVAFGLVVAVHLAAQLFGARTLAGGTQVLLVPALAGLVWSTGLLPARAGATRLYAGALLLSWLGDALPQLVDGEASFIAMVAFFLLAQACLVATYLLLTRRWPPLWVLAIYAAVFAALYLLCAPGAGGLLPLVAFYGLLLVAAGALSCTVSVVTGIGGALFVISDAMIALRRFVSFYQPPAHDFLVMITYIAAQALIAYGLVQHFRVRAASAGAGGSAQPGDRGGQRPA